jgi:hypothetical protein
VKSRSQLYRSCTELIDKLSILHHHPVFTDNYDQQDAEDVQTR